MNPTVKNTLAVIVGALIGIILSVATDIVLEKTGIFPTPEQVKITGFTVWWMLGLALFYRCVYTALGGYVTARLSAHSPMKMVMILGAFAFLGNLAGLIGTWNMNLSPTWYPIALTVLAFPCTFLGGRIEMD
ncbi:MAG TPA: hypothetical protein VK158_06815 [Acidobacteriota bacterium]|nr:hypothetical protein [Acidobacteriota bacterium]